MENFTISVDADGIALVTFDVPERSTNAISAGVQRDLDTLVATIKGDDAIRGVVLQSGKAKGFCAGADLRELPTDIARWRAATAAGKPAEGVSDAGGFSTRVRAIETCGKPVVAAIAGHALGGGLELALGCHYRVAVDDPAPLLALPEASLGLIPGGGGTQRLLRLMGLNAALPYLLDGTPISPGDALASGVIHAVVPAVQLIETARRWILDGGDAIAPWDKKGFQIPGGGPHGAAGYLTFGPAMAARRAGPAGRAAATANILKVVYEGAQVPIDAGLRIESRYFFNTAHSDDAVAKIEKFMARDNSVKM
ncbi:MAG: enoyl-CoA hydratase-related protein [Novosphingobium sp.]